MLKQILLGSCAVLLAACGGGGMQNLSGSSGSTSGAQSCDSTSCGTALVSMMDANGDFDSYTVDVTSLMLTRADGTSVQTLPETTRVDFATLVDLKELVTAATIPNGNYVSGTMTVDYSNADIEVDVNGVPVKAAVVDSNGMAVTTLDLKVELDNAHRLIIAPGTPAALDLDFDLAASNTVDLTSNPIEVTVQPVIVASLVPTDSRPARARGPLDSVNQAASSYVIDVRPFHLMSGVFGNLTVHTTATTSYEINGTPYVGAAGLTALAALAAATPSAAFGSFSTLDHSFTASIVRAGSSVEGDGSDALGGTVIARSTNLLTVRGATLIRSSGSVEFMRADVMLTVGAGTKVTASGAASLLDSSAISVGQHLEAFGSATLSGNSVSFDASAGRVRMEVTRVAGMVVATSAATLTLNVESIDRRDVSVFNFAGTGPSGQDADPTRYLIDTSTLSLSGFGAATPAEAFGFVTPFGAAPPDFQAQTLANFSQTRALLSVGWGRDGTTMPFSADAASGIVIDTTNSAIGVRHYIEIGPLFTDIRSLATPPSIVTDTTKSGLFAIGEPHSVQIFNDFTAFTQALSSMLASGDALVGLQATGSFNAATSALTSERVLVEFK